MKQEDLDELRNIYLGLVTGGEGPELLSEGFGPFLSQAEKDDINRKMRQERAPQPIKAVPVKPKVSQYTRKNLGDKQFADFKAGGGDAAVLKGASAGEIVAKGRVAQRPPAGPGGGDSGSSGNNSSGNGSGGPTTAPRPATTTAPKPAASPTKPMGGAPMDQWARANPTLAAKVKPGQSGYDTIKTRLSADNDRGPSTPTPNPVKANVPGFALGGKPPTSTDSGESDKLKIKKSDVTSGFDMFDVVKGYLIGEGYADTEEAALAIMANMSEDWKYSIMEQQISSVSANAPSGVKKPTVTASISAGGKTPPGQKMLDKAGQMLSGKGPSNNFGRGF